MIFFIVLYVILLGIHDAAPATHSLQYFYTGSSGVKGFPEFVTVGIVDGQPFTYYDSVLKKAIPKQDWMAKNEGPEYWENETRASIGAEQNFKADIEILKPRFNQTGGVHIVQRMYGCEWDDETGQVNGFDRYGYDGEDFIALDMKTKTWIAPKPQAVRTRQKWDSIRAQNEFYFNYFTEECRDWLKKYVNYGRSSLVRTELPSVSFLQKTPSSPVTCHATGFYPNGAELLWRKDGEEIHVGVEKGKILSNSDGTFQMSADLDLSSVGTQDWTKYECVFQFSGAQDIVHPLEKIKTNYSNSKIMIIPIIVAVVFLAVIAAIGLILYKKRNAKRPPSPPPAVSTEVREQMIPKA